MIRAILLACMVAFASSQSMDIPHLAEKLGATTLVELVVKANLSSALSGPGPFTVFGPTNEAFTRLPPQVLELLKNVTILRDVLLYHVVSGRVYSSQLSNDLLAQSLLPAEKIRINIYSHEHTVVTAEGSPVVAVDQNATNGVIHVVDRVMLPPQGNIPTVVTVNSKDFGVLLKAVVAAGLVETLSGDGPFTVFAPTDEAFAKIPPETLKALLADKAKLTKVLEYHVIPAAVWAAGVYDGLEAKTVEGSSLAFHVEGHDVMVGHSRVVYPNIAATNGVIHAIDTVLLPPELL